MLARVMMIIEFCFSYNWKLVGDGVDGVVVLEAICGCDFGSVVVLVEGG